MRCATTSGAASRSPSVPASSTSPSRRCARPSSSGCGRHDDRASAASCAAAGAARLRVRRVRVLASPHPTCATACGWRGHRRCSAKRIRVWAAGHLEKGREVTRSGPYRVHAPSAVCRLVGHGRRSGDRVGAAWSSRCWSPATWPSRSRAAIRTEEAHPDRRSSATRTTAYRAARRRRRAARRFSLGARDAQPRVSRAVRARCRAGAASRGKRVPDAARRPCCLPVPRSTYNRTFWRTVGSRDVGAVGAVSSVVEHRLYTPAVTGSSPVPPTSIATLIERRSIG